MYNFSSRVQTLGPGTMTINITSEISQAVSDLSFVNINDFVKNNDEFRKHKEDFKLYKIEEIAVTLFPDSTMLNEPTYINMDWFGVITTVNGLKNSDSTKIMYNSAVKPKTFFFRTPNLVYNGKNIRKFQDVDQDLYGKLYFYVGDDQSNPGFRAKIDARIVFKVPKEYVASRNLQLSTVNELSKLDISDAEVPKVKPDGISRTSFQILANNDPYWLQLEEDFPETNNIPEKKEKIDYKKQKKNEKKKERRKKKKEKLAALEKEKKIKKIKEKYEGKLKELENKEKQLEEKKQENKAWKEHNFYVAEGLANQKNEIKREAAQLKKYKENVHRQEKILNQKKKNYLSRKYDLEKKYPKFDEEKQQYERIKNRNQKWYGLSSKPSQSNESFSYQSSNKRKGRVCHTDKSMSVSQAFDESLWYA